MGARCLWEAGAAAVKQIQFEGAVHQFPDDFTDTDISAALATKSPAGGAPTQRGDGSIIRGPNTVGERLLGHLYEALPFVGAAGGAALGTPTGPWGTVAGGGLGYAGGRQASRVLADVISRIRGVPGPRPTGVGESAVRTGEDVMVGTLNEMTGGIGGRALQALRPRVPTPATFAAREAAGRTGITLTPAAAQGSPALAQVQALPTRLPIGGGPARRGLEMARESAQAGAERLATQAGGRESLSDAVAETQATAESIRRAQQEAPGELVERFIEGTLGTIRQGRLALGGSVQEALRDAAKGARRQASQLYDQALDAGGRGAPVPMARTHEQASEIVNMEARLRSLGSRAKPAAESVKGISATPPLKPENMTPDMLDEMLRSGRFNAEGGGGRVQIGAVTIGDLPQEMIQRYGLSVSRPRPLEEVLAIQQRLQAAMRAAPDDVSRRQLRQLTDAVTEDLRTFGAGSGTRFGPLLQRASEFYRTEVAQDFARKGMLRKLTDERAGQVGARLLRERDPEIIRGLMSRLHERQQDEVRRAVLEGLGGRAVDPSTRQLDPRRFEAELARFGDENLGYLMGPRVRELDGLRRVLTRGFGPGTQEEAYTRMLRGSATALAQQLTRGSARSTEDLLRVWPTIPAETQRSLTRGFITNTLEHAVDPVTGEFSVARFLSAKRAIPQAVWDRSLGSTEAATLRDLETVFRHITRVDRQAANPSGTAQGLMSAGQLIGIGEAGLQAALHPAGAAGRIARIGGLTGIPYALGRFVFSPTGRRFLVAPDVPIAAQTSSGMARTLYRLLTTQAVEAVNPAVQSQDAWESR